MCCELSESRCAVRATESHRVIQNQNKQLPLGGVIQQRDDFPIVHAVVNGQHLLR